MIKSVIVQVLAVAGALAVLGLWTLIMRSKGKRAAPPSQDVPNYAVKMFMYEWLLGD